jgi:hypothetical protein
VRAKATAGGSTMADELIICVFCKKGRVTKRMEGMAFRQSNGDNGYVHCRVMISIGTCDNCHAKSLDFGSDKILEQVFQQARLDGPNRFLR